MLIDDISKNLLSNQGLNFTPISSVDSFSSKDDYGFSLSGRSSFNSAINHLETDDTNVELLNSSGSENVTTTASSAGNYNSTYGYGLINGAAAVAQAAGKNTFADVPDLGGNNWGADLVKAPEVWAQGYTGQGVVVAVVDTGVDYNHEDLKNNIWTNTKEIAGNSIDDDGNGYIDDVYGWNFANNNNNIQDNNGHGTHISGTIAGENNNYGVTGIAYDAKIMPVKVLNESGSGSSTSVANGIYYAVDNGADVINLSLGSNYSNRTLKSAVEYASSKGVIVVMAAGNDGESLPDYPARYANKSGIAVGAVDKNNTIADFSNRSGSNEITYVTAPGVGIYSSVPGNQYGRYSGTSMATPHVAGVVALMLSANPNLTDAQVRQIVTETAGNSTQASSYSFNNFNVNSLVSQTITQTANYTPASSSNFNSFNVNSLVSQTSTQTENYLTPANNFNTISQLENNDMLVNPESWLQFQDYEKILSTNTNIPDGNSDNNNGNNPDFGNLLQIIQRRIEAYRKLLGMS
ncbi:MAG: S8 family serine peptidase [Komarekiella atlantica HA4396-MV6]|jgi:subtilisin family serine protease|nr:S8 family serine peptidase [Komarekiella atlantica HA4396-MV6]